MRRARHKNSESTYYHVLTRVAGAPDFCPLEEWEACRKLYLMIVHFTRAYGCVLVSLEIMGTHYHFILWMEQYRKLTRPELARRARLLWGEQEAVRKMAQWDEAGWERFNRRLFDLSALMQHLNGEYAKWYNRTHGRHGPVQEPGTAGSGGGPEVPVLHRDERDQGAPDRLAGELGSVVDVAAVSGRDGRSDAAGTDLRGGAGIFDGVWLSA